MKAVVNPSEEGFFNSPVKGGWFSRQGEDERGGVLLVIPAHAGIQRLCLCFFVSFFRIPANEWEMKNRSVAIFLGSGFRHAPE